MGQGHYLLSALLISLSVPSSAWASLLIVELYTDLTPGTELGWVRSDFRQLAGDGTVHPEDSVMSRWFHYSESTGWPGGVRVGQSPGFPAGTYRGLVSIYNTEGGLVLSRPVRLELSSGTVQVIAVLISRTVTPPQPGYLPGTDTSHWTSEEFDTGGDTSVSSKDPIECPVNLAMHGLGCNGGFCDNVRLFCRAVPGLYAQTPPRWTSFFSEGAGYQGCNANEFVTGLECKGDFCDEISLRCTEHYGLVDLCYVTGPISEESDPGADPPKISEFIDPTNGYVRRILCEGEHCDNKTLEICRLKNFPLIFGAFSDLCVTSVGGVMRVGVCLSAENGGNTPQVWTLDLQTGQIVNPITLTCLTALGGSGSVTEEPCAEAGDTSWFMDGVGRLSSLDSNNNPLCLSVVGVQDPLGPPPIDATMELGACSNALYQLFEPSNAALPPPLPELEVSVALPVLVTPMLVLLVGAISAVGALMIRRRLARANAPAP